MKNIGQKIKQVRVMRNMTQQNIAEKMEVARNTVSQWETNERKMSAEQLLKYAKIVNVTLDYFEDETIDETLFSLMAKLSTFFSDNDIANKDKDKAYQDIMKIYLKSKERIENIEKEARNEGSSSDTDTPHD